MVLGEPFFGPRDTCLQNPSGTLEVEVLGSTQIQERSSNQPKAPQLALWACRGGGCFQQFLSLAFLIEAVHTDVVH